MPCGIVDVPRVHLDVGDQQLARFLRLHDRLLRDRRLDLLPFLRLEAIRPANLAGGTVEHLPDTLGHRRPHHALERVQVLHEVGLGRPGRLDGDRERLDAGAPRGEEEVAEATDAGAERDVASAGAERAAVADVDEHQAIFDDRQAVNRLDAGLHPSAEVGGDADALATALDRPHRDLRIAFALDGDVDAEFLGELVEVRERRAVGGHDQSRRADRFGELEHLATRRIVATDGIDAVCKHLLAKFFQPVHRPRSARPAEAGNPASSESPAQPSASSRLRHSPPRACRSSASISESVSDLIAAAGTPTRQSNQMFLSAAPTRIVPRLEPVGRIEIDGICSGSGRTRGCCANADDRSKRDRRNDDMQRLFHRCPQS